MPPPQSEAADEPIQGSAAGATVQLGADYLSYARERYDAKLFKEKLVERLLPTVPLSGRPHPVRPGQIFGKFQILEPLGKGGMAQVFLALDPERVQGEEGFSAERPEVAIKVMKADIALDPEYVKRFLREAANTALIEHANVVSVFEVGSVEGRLYFTMEVIEGMTLKEHLRQGPVLEEEGVQILCQIFDGLLAAHRKGVAHRDLKPANVMLLTSQSRYGFSIQGEFGIQVKVTDFGLAHQMRLDQSSVQGRFLGTAKYIPPEVALGGPATFKSDVFSLGILAFAMFSGEAPFRAKHKLEYITANVEQEAPILRELVPVSAEISALVDRMLEKDPDGRPSAEAVGRDLRRLAKRQGRAAIVVRDDPESTFYHLRVPSEEATDESASARIAAALPEGVDAATVRALLPWAAGAGGVLVLLVAVLLLRGGGSPPAPTPPPSISQRPLPTATRPSATPIASAAPSPLVRRPAPPSEPLREAVPLPVSAAFTDTLARSQFLRVVREGDARWEAGDAPGALTKWRDALEKLVTEPPQALADRLHAGVHAVYLTKGRQLEEAGDVRGAQALFATGAELAPGDRDLRAALTRTDAALVDIDAVTAGLKQAKVLAFSPEKRGEARTLLQGLLPAAERVGLQARVQSALRELGE